ncbi:SURP and G-patch domain-containing protein 1 [Quaeritorhiza haematococci]|nr:SURP and G-patch domain-containing protein 1 [Quaeritorhiza haematococci]
MSKSSKVSTPTNVNTFANDGSFLASFLAAKQRADHAADSNANAGKESVLPPTASKSTPTLSTTTAPKTFNLGKKSLPRPVASKFVVKTGTSFSVTSSNTGREGGTARSLESSTSSTKKVKLDLEDADVITEEEKGIIERTSEFVVRHGSQFEDFTRNKNVDNPKFRYYRSKLEKLRAAGSASASVAVRPSSPTSSSGGTDSSWNSNSVSAGNTTGAPEGRKKKRRWDDATPSHYATSSATTSAASASMANHTPHRSSQPCASPVMLEEARTASYSPNRGNLSPTTAAALAALKKPSMKRQFTKLYDKYEPGMIAVGNKWAWPEDEIIDEGGTWEHKKRALEMSMTEEKAKKLTEAAQQRKSHHIGDYIPKEELDRFEQQVRALKEGKSGSSSSTPPQHEDHANNKLDESNIGFKMLQKQGWSAGKGLGASNQGITAPVNR